MSNREILRIILQPYLTCKDIQKINGCSKSQGYNLIKVVKARYPDRITAFQTQIRTCDYLDVFELKLEDFVHAAELEQKYLKGEEL